MKRSFLKNENYLSEIPRLAHRIGSCMKGYARTSLIFDFGPGQRMRVYGLSALAIGCVAFTISLFHPVLLPVHLIVGAAYLFSFGLPLGIMLEAWWRWIGKSGRNPGDFYMYEIWAVSFLAFFAGFFILGTIQNIVEGMHLSMFSYYFDPEKGLRAYSIDYYIKMIPVWIIDTNLAVHLFLKKRKPRKNDIDSESPGDPESSQAVTFSSGTSFMTFNPRHITHISVEEHYAKIHALGNGEEAVNEIKLSLTRILDRLPDGMFIRIHRSHAVNLLHVARMSKQSGGYRILLKNSGETLPVSRRNISSVRIGLAQKYEEG